MVIAYPRALPSVRIQSVEFELLWQEAFAPEHGGRFVSTELGEPLWTLKIGTTPPSEVEYSRWRAWLASLRGSGREFYGYDVRRPLPWNYRAGFAGLLRAVSGLAFNGTTTSWSVNVDRDILTLGAAANQELPVGFNLIEGDYIGLKKSTNIRSVHRVLDDANANGSGVGAWTVEPPVHPSMPADATVTLIKPEALMVVTTRESGAEGKGRRVAFEAAQHLEFE